MSSASLSPTSPGAGGRTHWAGSSRRTPRRGLPGRVSPGCTKWTVRRVVRNASLRARLSTRNSMMSGSTDAPVLTRRRRCPRKRLKSMSRSTRSAGVMVSPPRRDRRGAGSRPASVPMIRTASLCTTPASSTRSRRKKRPFAALRARKRYQRASTSRWGQLTPLTRVNGPVTGAVVPVAGRYWNLNSSCPVSVPVAGSVSRLRSVMISGISWSPPGNRRRSSSSSRITYRPASPAWTLKRVTAIAWSWYQSAVAGWRFGYSVSCVRPGATPLCAQPSLPAFVSAPCRCCAQAERPDESCHSRGIARVFLRSHPPFSLSAQLWLPCGRSPCAGG